MSTEMRGYPPQRLLPLSRPRISEVFMARKAWTPMMLPPNVRLSCIGAFVSISGFLYGFDTGSIGPVTQMARFPETAGHLSSSMEGFFVASILLSASASSLASGVVADRISRRYGIGVGAIIFALGALLSATGRNYAMLQVARLITGIGAGQMISVASIYLAEIAPSRQRGKLVCMLSLAITVGVMTGYFFCYGTSRLDSSIQWRLPFVLSAAVSLVLCCATLLFIPFSPRWLLEKGQDEQALYVLRQLRLSSPPPAGTYGPSDRLVGEDTTVYQELELIKIAIAEARRTDISAVRFRDLFTKRYRGRSILGIALMTFLQLTGIDVIMYFAPVVFQSIFTSQTASFLASGVSGIVLVVSTIPAQIWVDQWGRKPTMVWGGLGMTACFLIVGSLFARFGQSSDDGVQLTGGNAKWAIVLSIYAFLAIFSCTWSVVTRIYATEIMPTKLRSRAAASQQLANWSTNFVIALIAPSFLRASPSGPYFFFASTLLISTVICIVFMKETKHKTLEEITEMFETRAA